MVRRHRIGLLLLGIALLCIVGFTPANQLDWLPETSAEPAVSDAVERSGIARAGNANGKGRFEGELSLLNTSPQMRFALPVGADQFSDFVPASGVELQLNAETADLARTLQGDDNPISLSATVYSPQRDAVISHQDEVLFHIESGTFDQPIALEFVPEQAADAESIAFDSPELLRNFEVNIVNQLSGEVQHQFEQPIRVVLDLREYGIDLDEEGGAFFFAFRNPENPSELIDVPVTVHDATGLISAEVTHFSSWATGWRPEGWTLHWDLPTASGFNGAATYSYPIDVPPSRGGFQPMVNLSYSSSALDGVTKEFAGGTVADGWSLNEIAIVRTNVRQVSECGSNAPEKFRLVLNGAGHKLVRDGSRTVEGGLVYSLKDSPGIRAIRFSNNDGMYWIVQTPDGTSYRLGYYQNAETMYELNCRNGTTSYSTGKTQRFELEWHVDTSTDAFGNMIVYRRDNSQVTSQTSGFNGSRIRNFGSRPTAIYYNFDKTVWSYPVSGPFFDMGHWADRDTSAATRIDFKYTGAQLDRIEVVHNAQTTGFATQRYDFATRDLSIENQCVRRTDKSSGSERQLKVVTSTKILDSITESSRTSANGAWVPLPVQRFEYEPLSNFDKTFDVNAQQGIYTNGKCFQYYRLKTVDNGYGGSVSFEYTSDRRDHDSKIGNYVATASAPRDYPNSANSWYVTGIRADDGLGHRTYTRFTRTGRCYVQEDAGLRCGYNEDDDRPKFGRLSGFSTVTQEQMAFDANVVLAKTVTQYNQGNLGFGRPSSVTSYSRAGKVTKVVETKYTEFTVRGAIYRPVESVTTTSYVHNGNSLPTKVSYVYDRDGNRFGHLLEVETRIGSSALNNGSVEEKTIHSYRYGIVNLNDDLWRTGQLGNTVVQHRGTEISKTSFGYSADGNIYTSPTQVTAGSDGDYVTTRTRFDDWGNVRLTIDAKGEQSSIAYDKPYHLYPVKVTDPAGNCTYFEIYGFSSDKDCDNKTISFTSTAGKPGLLHTVVDANRLKTSYAYDVHGRLVRTYLPNDSKNWATRTTYFDGQHPFRIQSETRGSLAPTTVQYFDGFGRPFMTEQQGVLVGSDSKTLLTLTGYDELGQVARQTAPFEINGSMENRFYSFDLRDQDFRLPGYRDSFSDGKINTSEWPPIGIDGSSLPARFEIKDNAMVINALNSETQGYLIRTDPETKAHAGDEVWGFDFKIRNPGKNTVNLGLRQGDYDNANYRAMQITIPWNSDQIELHQSSGYLGQSRKIETLMPWALDKGSVEARAGDEKYSSWYHIEFKRNAGTGTIHVTLVQRDDPSKRVSKTMVAGNSFKGDAWEIIFQTLGDSSSIVIDNYYEFVDVIKPAGTRTVHAHTFGNDGLVTPGDVKTYAPDGNVTTVLNTITTDVTVGVYGTLMKQTVTDANANKVEHFTNIKGQLSLVREFIGSNLYTNTHYHYDGRGNLEKVLRKNGSGTTLTTTTMGYDGLSRKTSMTDPDMGSWIYRYDANGNLTAQRDAKQQWLCFRYDELNRLDLKWTGNGNCNSVPAEGATNWLASYIYDTASGKGIGQIDTIKWQGENGLDQDVFTYDSVGRLTAQARTINGQTFTMSYSAFDALNRAQKMTYPDGIVAKTTFDKMGPDQLRIGAASTVDSNDAIYVSSVTHNALGQITKIDRNELKSEHVQDTVYTYAGAAGNYRLERITHGEGTEAASNTITDYIYTYDRVGNIDTLTEIDSQTLKIDFGYDRLYRLTSATKISGNGSYDTRTYSHDPLGNIDNTSVNGQWIEYRYGASQPQAVTEVDDDTFGYDANGNMTSRTDGSASYDQAFDTENRLVSVTDTSVSPNQITHFKYDPAGQRTMMIEPDGTITYYPFPNYEETHSAVAPPPTNTPTITSKPPTITPVPPTVVPPPPPVPTGWNIRNGHGSGVPGSATQIQVTGTGVDWDAQFNRVEGFELESGEKVSFDFYVDRKNTKTHLSVATAWGNGHQRVAILDNNNTLSVQVYRRDEADRILRFPLLSESEFKANTWYRGSITLDDINGFLVEVEQRDNPAIKGTYREDGGLVQTGQTWRFLGIMWEGTVFFDNYTVETINLPEPPKPPVDNEIKYDIPKIDYANVGLTNGIPTYENEIRLSGVINESTIEQAIRNAPPFSRIILPAGIHNIGTIDIRRSDIVLAGDLDIGCGETVLRFGNDDSGIRIDAGGRVGSSVNLTADAPLNSYIITISNASGFNVGDYVMIRQNDDPSLFRLDLSRNTGESWAAGNATQMNKIVGKSGNTLTLEGGLNLNYKTSLNARVAKVTNMISGVGIENLTLDRTGDDYADRESANIYFRYAANSWVNGVHSKHSVRAHIGYYRSYKGEVRGSFLDRSYNNGGGGHGYGVRLDSGTTDVLVENNIARLMRHSFIVQTGGNGNVFGYNYSADPYGEGFGEIYTDLSVHGGFGFSNLFEGNQAQHAKVDNIHASNAYNLFLRNRLEQDLDNYTYSAELESKGASTPHIWVHENQYYNSFLANEISFPGANEATDTVGFSDGRLRDNFTVCKFTNASDGVRGCGRTRETTFNHGTFDYLTGQMTWDSSTSERDFPVSVYRSEKPDFYGDVAWPNFGPDTLNMSEADKMVPAKNRYLAALNGDASYCYYDKSTNPSPPIVTPPTVVPPGTVVPPTGGGSLSQEAEDGTLVGDFEIVTVNDSGVSGNAYVTTDQSVPDNGSGPNTDQRIDFTMTIPESGSYRVLLRVRTPDGGSDSFYVGAEGNTPFPYYAGVKKDNFVDGKPTNTLNLTAGERTVTIYHRESGAELDYISVYKVGTNPATPTPSGGGTGGTGPTSTPTPVASGGPLSQEAEDGTLVGDFEIITVNDSGVSGNAYVTTDQSVPDNGSGPNADQRIDFTMSIPESGSYRVLLRVRTPDGGSDSFYVGAEGNTPFPYYAGVKKDNFVDGKPTNTLNLTAGERTVTIYHRESGAELDYISVYKVGTNPATPTPSGGGTGGTGPTSTPTPVLSGGPLSQEAEDGTLVGDFEIVTVNGSGVSGNAYVTTDQSVPDNGSGPNTDQRIDFTMTIPESGSYRVLLRVRTPDGGSDSFYVGAEGNTPFPYYAGVKKDNFVDGKPNNTLNLTAGERTVTIYHRESGAELDYISVYKVGTNPATPTPSGGGTGGTGPVSTPEPVASGGPLSQEAEDGTLVGGFEIVNVNDSGVSGNAYVTTAQSLPKNTSGPNTDQRIDFEMTIPESGSYRVLLRVRTPDGGSDSFYVGAEGNTPFPYYAGVKKDNFVDGKPNNTLNLTAGERTVTIYHRESGAELDYISVYKVGTNPATPTPSPSGAFLPSDGEMAVERYVPGDTSKFGGDVMAEAGVELDLEDDLRLLEIGPNPVMLTQQAPASAKVRVTARRTFLLGSTPILHSQYERVIANATEVNRLRQQGPLWAQDIENLVVHTLYTDHLGSASSTLNWYTGESSQTKFYPYGETRNESAQAVIDQTGRGFTGHRENRDIGLTYMNARFYVPGIGRFASADTIVPEPLNPQSFNRFSYVNNNPLRFSDPTGHCARDENNDRVLSSQADIDCWSVVDYLVENYHYPIENIQDLDFSFGNVSLDDVPDERLMVFTEGFGFERMFFGTRSIELDGDPLYRIFRRDQGRYEEGLYSGLSADVLTQGITRLTDNITQAREDRADTFMEISLGTTGMVIGAAEIAFGLGAEIPTAGLSTVVTVAGVVHFGLGAFVTGLAVDDFINAYEDIPRITYEVESLSAWNHQKASIYIEPVTIPLP